MGPFEIFIIRILLSVLISVLMCRVFFQRTEWFMVAGLAFVLLGIAYLMEYLKKRDKGGGYGT